MISDPWFYAAAVPAILIAGLSKGGFGGIGAMSTPILALAIDPRAAAAVMLPILCLMDLIGLWAYWGKWNRSNLVTLIAASVVGITVGALTFRYLDPDAIRILIGAIAVSFALRRWLAGKQTGAPPARPSLARGGFWGAVAGFTSFVSHSGSPPAAIYLLPLRLDKTTYQATSVVFFAAVNYIKLLPYWLLGQFSDTNLSASAVLVPLAVAGMFLGVWLHKRASDRLFFSLAYLFLFGIGIKLLYDGISGLLS